MLRQLTGLPKFRKQPAILERTAALLIGSNASRRESARSMANRKESASWRRLNCWNAVHQLSRRFRARRKASWVRCLSDRRRARTGVCCRGARSNSKKHRPDARLTAVATMKSPAAHCRIFAACSATASAVAPAPGTAFNAARSTSAAASASVNTRRTAAASAARAAIRNAAR